MLIRLYSVYDRVAHVYTEPFSSPNDASAARAFTLASSDADSLLSASPQDYSLWYIGCLDNNAGELHSCDGREFEPYKVCDGKPREVTEYE